MDFWNGWEKTRKKLWLIGLLIIIRMKLDNQPVKYVIQPLGWKCIIQIIQSPWRLWLFVLNVMEGFIVKSKYFFKDHKKMVEYEHKEYDTYQEKTKIEFPKCDHQKLDFIGQELRCLSCGNAWTGTGAELQKLYNLLTK